MVQQYRVFIISCFRGTCSDANQSGATIQSVHLFIFESVAFENRIKKDGHGHLLKPEANKNEPC